MRTSFAARFALAAAFLLGASSSIFAQDACDNSAFKGAFGYALKGNVYDSYGYTYYLGAAGRVVSDGAGSITGADTISYDGNTVKRKLTGTYNVNEDCTGSLVINGDDGSITHADFVVVDDGKEISLVQTDGGFILTGNMKRQKQVQGTTPTPTEPVQ